MKVVKKSISLPKDLYQFAEKEAANQAKERGSEVNISAYLRELLVREKNQKMSKAA
jgi:metal-responsive CopG/Arc/MetJ family transcriptional regulator